MRFSAFVLALGVHASYGGAAAQSTSAPVNPAIDMPGFLRVAIDAAAHRDARRLTESEFLRMSREPGTIVLDAIATSTSSGRSSISPPRCCRSTRNRAGYSSGRRRCQSVARWNPRPILISVASANGAPISCMPIGSPSAENPAGSDSAQAPR
jgi:hypothetical protein